MMRKFVLGMVTAASLVAGGAAATAATKTADKQVDIEANQMEIFDTEKKAVFRGNVDAKRTDVSLKCDELTVRYEEVKQPDGSSRTDATDLDAKGNVMIKTNRETITGDWAKFDPQSNELVVGGNVRVVQGTTVLTG